MKKIFPKVSGSKGTNPMIPKVYNTWMQVKKMGTLGKIKQHENRMQPAFPRVIK